MKLELFLIIAIILLAIGCKEKGNKVEILNNPELDYFTDDEVDNPATLTNDDWKKENSEILFVANEVKQSHKNFPDKIALYFRVFINEKGKVVALKKLKQPIEENKIIENELMEKIGDLLSKKKITPAKKVGEPVNFRKDFKIGFETFNDSLRVFLPDLLAAEDKFFLAAKAKLKSTNYDLLNEEDFYIAVEEMPEPIGGIVGIAEKVRYPEIAKRAGIQGRVFVKALIDEKGFVAGTSVIKGIGAGCDQAAMEAVMQSKFKPGRQRGKPVKVQVTIPILFKLQ